MPRRPDDHVPGRSADWRPHDTDRSIDPFDGGPHAARAPSSRPPALPSRPAPPGRPGTPRAAGGRLAPRTLLLAGGGCLAVVATALVFLTDDVDLLRVGVVAAAWAFVLAAFAAGRRGTEEAGAAEREAALRRTYEHELEREVAARREYELELENELRREAQDAMRAELDGLRQELTAVAELRGEVARVAALRDDVLALTALRSDIGQVGELRTELGRLRAELAEQLSSEMLVERIVMRTQASRVSGGESPRLESPASWHDEPPRELTGGWPAVRLDEHSGTQQYERVRVDRTPPPHPWQTVTSAAATPPYTPPPVPEVQRVTPPPPAPPTETYGASLEPGRSRHAAHGDDAEPVSPPPSPVEWLAARSLLDDPGPGDGGYEAARGVADRPSPYPRRRRGDDDLPPAPLGGPDDLLTTERPTAPPTNAAYLSIPPAVPPAPPAVPPAAEPPAGHARLEEILAESGVRPANGSRRRRRYRDEDDAQDDVLARVLRGE